MKLGLQGLRSTPVGVTVAKSVDEGWPPGIAKYSATTAPEAVGVTVAKSVVEARLPGIAKYRATAAPEAVGVTVAKSVVEARPPGIAKYSATTAPEAVDVSRRKVCCWSSASKDCEVQCRDSCLKLSIQQARSLLDEARPPGIVKYTATTAPEAVGSTGAKSVVEAGSSWRLRSTVAWRLVEQRQNGRRMGKPSAVVARRSPADGLPEHDG